MRKVIPISLVLLVLMAAVVFAGGGQQGAASGKPIVGISLPTKEQAFWPLLGAQYEKIFPEAGYKIILEYAEDVPERQIMQVENMITRGAKILMVTPVDGFSLTDVCKKAKEAGCIIISCDRLIMNTKDIDYFVTYDLFKAGV
jgi:putative multiple sugar transport system substrate-binding protein